MTPRQTIRAYILATLRSITIENGYAVSVRHVELHRGLTRDINLSLCPAILAMPLEDSQDRETMGGESANKFYRLWSWDLTLLMSGPNVLQEELGAKDGEAFVNAVLKALLTKRQNAANTSLPHDIMINQIKQDVFELIESGMAQFTIPITVKYVFRPQDL
jgi:hypothetical protein